LNFEFSEFEFAFICKYGIEIETKADSRT